MKTKKEFYDFTDNEAREIALAMRPCFASYSSTSYVKMFANKRYETWVLTLKDRDIEIPSDIQDKVHKVFISTFINVIKDYIESLPKTTNPHILKVLNKKEGK
jgi:hypothetical protein